MRRARLKPNGRDVYYHVYNRVAGTSADRPFAEVEKMRFLNLLHRLQALYTVEVLGYTIMDNHFHLMLFAPATAPDDHETCARVTAYYQGRVRIHPQTPRCREIAERLRDISCFMHDIEHQFTGWFNRTRPICRRGALWAGRFKHTLLDPGVAVWDCWKYIEMNPVRAGIVVDPGEYRFSSFGYWSARGRHPFADAAEQRLMPILGPLLGIRSQRDLFRSLRRAFTLIRTLNDPPEVVDRALADASAHVPFIISLTRHVRYWTDGLIIGGQGFIQEMLALTTNPGPTDPSIFTAADGGFKHTPPMFSLRRLRTRAP